MVWLQQAGVRSPIFGWSGIVDRKLSNFSLNKSKSHFIMFLRFGGNELNSWPPCTFRVASLSVFTLLVDLLLTGGILTSRPLLSEKLSSTPGFGTCFSRIFQM